MCPIISLPELLIILTIVLLMLALGRIPGVARGIRRVMRRRGNSMEDNRNLD